MRVGGCTFAEDPRRDAFTARILWTAQIDPGVVPTEARRACPGDDCFDLSGLASLATIVQRDDGREHLALSDGTQRLRLDILTGSLRAGAVLLDYRLSGIRALDPRIVTLRRLGRLCRQGAFPVRSSPQFAASARLALALRVYDGRRAAASHREIANVLFGAERVEAEWNRGSDSLQSRIRRLVKLATSLAGGGYRTLLG